jgi:hypothetical protein
VTDSSSLIKIADEVSRALSFAKETGGQAMIVTPLLYPGGGRVALRFEESSSGYFVSDAGAGRREAELMGGGAVFTRIARSFAERFGVRFDSDLVFDIEVPREALVAASMAVANASKQSVDGTATRLSEQHAIDQRDQLWGRLIEAFPGYSVGREQSIFGASAEWRFDAIVSNGSRQSVFDIVSPHPNSVHAAVSKFLDLKDLGEHAPGRVAVALNKDTTPHLALLGRTAKIIDISASLAAFRAAA